MTRLDATRQAALYAAKLQALVTDRWGDAERQPEPFGPGAALVAASSDSSEAPIGLGPEAWVYVPEMTVGPGRGLGAVLVWADRHDAVHLHVLLDAPPDDGLGVLARQARYFAEPRTDVWRISGRDVSEVPPARFPPRRDVPASPDLVDLLIDAGVEVLVEDGVVRGEVEGLEVARIVHGATSAGVPVDVPYLEVGVGAADRELTAMVHGELTPQAQLARVAEIVRAHRQADAPFHPLNQLAPERWLRARLVRDPGLVGLSVVCPADPGRSRAGLRERDIAVAVGETPKGRTVVVACSVGVDVDLVPTAADARAALHPDAELWLVVPERDDHPTTRHLASCLRAPARVVPVTDDWRVEG